MILRGLVRGVGRPFGNASQCLQVQVAAQRGFATAKDLADYLVKQGVPSRDAHEVVAAAVRFGPQRGMDLAAAAEYADELPRRDRVRRTCRAGAARLARRAPGAGRHRAGTSARADRGAPGAARLSACRARLFFT